MALKNWFELNTKRKDFIEYQKKDNAFDTPQDRITIVFFDGRYEVYIFSTTELKIFATKKEAKAYAMAYMRKH